MRDQDKTKQQLIGELIEMRQRVAALEAANWMKTGTGVATNSGSDRAMIQAVAEPVPVFIKPPPGSRTEANQDRNRLQAMLTAAIECLPFDFFALGTDDRCIIQNAVNRKHLGDLLGKRLEECPIDDATRQVWADNNRRAFAGERVEREVEMQVGGETRYRYDIVTPIRDATNLYGILGVSIDVTERKRAEERLHNSERTLRTLIDASPESIVLLDTEKTVLIVNETAAYRLGKTVDEITGRKAYDLVPADVAAPRNKQVEEVIRTGKPVRFEDQRSERHYDTAMHPVMDEKGNVAAVAVLSIERTERKRAEETLQKAHDELEAKINERTAELIKANEELAIFRKFVEASGEGLGMASFDGRIVYANPTLCRLFGETTPEDVIGKPVSTYYREEYVQRRQNEIIPALLRDGYWHAEETVLPRHGKLIPTLQSAFLIRDDNGSPFRIAAVISDITEQKQAEEALRQSEERYRTLVEASPDAVLMTDLEGHITFASQRAAELHGCEGVDELIGRNPLEVIAPEDHSKFLADLRQILKRGISRNVEYTFVRKDGTRYPGEASGVVVKDKAGKPMALMALVRDITERKAAEEALRASEERFRSYFVQGLMGMAVTRPDKQWQEVNDRLCEILGYSRQQLLRMKWTDATHPDDREAGSLLFGRMIAGEIDHYTYEKRFLRKSGEVVYAHVFIRCFRRKDGTVDHILALVEDITGRKAAEESLRHEHRTLKHMLRASDHERRMIAYDIHDGLAQQLAGAIMQFEVFDHLKEAKPKQASDAYHAAMTMLRQGHSDARRLISGVRPPILDESGVVAAIAHLVNDPGFQGKPHVVFHSTVEFKRLTPVLENVIYRIVQEGLTNAFQHSQSEMVRVTLRQQGQKVRIEIRDWGVGFDPKAMLRDRFGLAGIRERARLLGGKCRIRSKPGEGTAIVVELPIAEQEAEE